MPVTLPLGNNSLLELNVPVPNNCTGIVTGMYPACATQRGSHTPDATEDTHEVLSVTPTHILIRIDHGLSSSFKYHGLEPNVFPLPLRKYPNMKLRGDTTGHRYTIHQFPARPFLASTVHRCQGLTLASIYIGSLPSDSNALYVAISRVRNISDLYLSLDLLSTLTIDKLRTLTPKPALTHELTRLRNLAQQTSARLVAAFQHHNSL